MGPASYGSEGRGMNIAAGAMPVPAGGAAGSILGGARCPLGFALLGGEKFVG